MIVAGQCHYGCASAGLGVGFNKVLSDERMLRHEPYPGHFDAWGCVEQTMQDTPLGRRVDLNRVMVAPHDVGVLLDVPKRQPKPKQGASHDRQPALKLRVDDIFGTEGCKSPHAVLRGGPCDDRNLRRQPPGRSDDQRRAGFIRHRDHERACTLKAGVRQDLGIGRVTEEGGHLLALQILHAGRVHLHHEPRHVHVGEHVDGVVPDPTPADHDDMTREPGLTGTGAGP